jgi:hypothetical protein
MRMLGHSAKWPQTVVSIYIINIEANDDDYGDGNNNNNKLHDTLKMLYLHPGLYILM